ncbi:serine/threonine-protein kinase [Actinocorallia aurantiaca]|uniref:non-specific serine/threonine protein kinase n=1 Tax=Actinocorallia aurantiaca TaxID=46204 RepID=A0ABN3UA91_9ACTN
MVRTRGIVRWVRVVAGRGAEARVRAGLELAGRYRLEESLGRGGFGEVWSAEDLLRDRRVAVKFLYREVAENSPVWLSKFRQEARIAVRLNHPGITAVDDFGEYDGQWYLVMEFLEGGNLAEEITRHPQGLAIPRVQVLSVQIAEALAAAHGHGIVHRDLKPANLVLLAGDRVKVCDFGIAHIAESTTTHTLMGKQVGTPAYMAPEQWLGEDVDHRTDLYALGGILYTLLTGRPPFRGASVPALMGQHLNLEPAPPGELRPDTPPHLDRLVLALLAKNPADRPTGRQLIDGLDPDGRPRQIEDAAPREEPAPTPAPAVRETPGADVQEMIDTGVRRMASGDLGAARELLRTAVGAGDPDRVPQAMVHLGGLEEKQGDPAAARDWYLRAVDSRHAEWTPRSMTLLGFLEADQGNLLAARDWYLRVVDSGHPDQAPKAMFDLGGLEEKQGNPLAARDWYMRAANSGHAEWAPRAMSALGAAASELEDGGTARYWYMRAVESGHAERALEAMAYLGGLEQDEGHSHIARGWYLRMLDSGHPDYVPEAMIYLGALEEDEGNLRDAWGWYRRIVDSGHAESAPEAMVHLGKLEEKLGNVRSAHDWYRLAADSGHPDQAPQAMIHLGALAEEQYRFPEARDWYLRAVGTGHECAAEAMIYLGALEEGQRNLPAAVDWYRRSADSGHPDWAERAREKLAALEKRSRPGLTRQWFSR